MALATTCPHCQTTFRVAADQLKLRGGIVRCGTCQQVFDGNTALVDLDAPASAPAPDPVPTAASSLPEPAADPQVEAVESLGDDSDAQASSLALAEPDLEFGARAIAPPAPPQAPEAVEAKLLADPDFDAEPESEPEDDYLPSPGIAFDAEMAAVEEAAARLKRGYVLDYDLSEPATKNADSPFQAQPAWPESELGPDAGELDDIAQAEFEEGPATVSYQDHDNEYGYEYGHEHEQNHEREPEPEPNLERGDDHDLLPEPDQFCEVAFDSRPGADEGEPALADEPGAAFSAERPGPPSVLDIEHGPLPLLRESAGAEPRQDKPDVFKPAPVVLPEPEPEPDEPEFVRVAREQELAARKRRIIMAVGSAVLALVLLAQGLTTFRNVLVARFPGLKPVVSAACAPMRCKIELPAQIEALSIEKGELQSLGPSTFEYVTVLRNESSLTQAWPHIELELNDADDKPLVRRVFTPAQYLATSVAPARGFPAGSEQAVKIHFQLKQLTASGYHIAVFYP